jgi:hypothetical protein
VQQERFVCVHGHFYQPPRENPWLEAVERQDSARPYHDWNERITAECYRPNVQARILDGQGRLQAVVNNFASMSFNVGPTLLNWLEREAADVYAAILAADQVSRQRFGGHGSAMAQAYNHVILPLCSRRDRLTEIRWGLRDFERRFGRRAEGFWLPETAVDAETLELLDQEGVRFTILSPSQAARLWSPDLATAEDIGPQGIDTTQPYRVKAGSRLLNLAVFFYHPQVAHAIAFGGLLDDGEQLARALVEAAGDGPGPRLGHVATDGESYGHHHAYGEMALAYALHRIEESGTARLTNYGEFLSRFPPRRAVEVHDHTAWSCAHGLERWRSDCGCQTGGHPGWSQAWRKPLREALDYLRDTLTPPFQERAGALLTDPDAARDAYIEVILDRSEASRRRYLDRFARRPLPLDEQQQVWKLMELARYALLMYTSCGWFFDDVSGIETVQVLQYAGRVLQLAADVFGWTPEAEVMARLEAARSNLAAEGDARRVFDVRVRPAMMDLGRVAAHWAVAALTGSDGRGEMPFYCYRIHVEDQALRRAGRTRLLTGRVTVTSAVTLDAESYYVGALFWGDHNLVGGLARATPDDGYVTLRDNLNALFDAADVAGVLRVFQTTFGTRSFTLRSLCRDEQTRVLDRVLKATLEDAEGALRQIYAHHAPLMRFISETDSGLPPALRATAGFVLEQDVLRLLSEGDRLDRGRLRQVLDEAAALGVHFDREAVAFALRAREQALAHRWRDAPTDPQMLAAVAEYLDVADDLSSPWDPGILAVCAYALRGPLTEPGIAPAVRAQAADLARRLRVRWIPRD